MQLLRSLGFGAAISLAFSFVFLLTGATWPQVLGIFLISFIISAVITLLFGRGSDEPDPLEREINQDS